MDARSAPLGARARSSSATASRQGLAVVSQGAKREAKVTPPGSTGRMASPSRTARSTSPKAPRSPSREDRGNLDQPPKPVVIYSDFPDIVRTAEVSGDRSGQQALRQRRRAMQICEPPARNAQIRRLNTDARAQSLMRSVSATRWLDFHPINKELYFTDNGRDLIPTTCPMTSSSCHPRRGSTSASVLPSGDCRTTSLAQATLQRIRAADCQARTASARSACASTLARCSRRSIAGHLRRAPRLLEQVGEDRAADVGLRYANATAASSRSAVS